MKNCRHCGQSNYLEDSNFCCNGCQEAFKIINELGFANYYKLRNQNEDNLKLKPENQYYQDIANFSTQKNNIDNQQNNSFEINFFVKGLHCAACIWLIESILKKNSSVIEGRINLSRKSLYINYSGDKSAINNIIKIINNIGYQLMPLDKKIIDEAEKSNNNELFKAMAVAGFGAGNIMLFSFALWFYGVEEMGIATRNFLHFFSALLALPVIFYSSQVFFKSAFNAIKNRYSHMDIPIAIAIFLACLVSLIEAYLKKPHIYFDSAVMLIFFLLIGRYLDYKTRKKVTSIATEFTMLSASYGVLENSNGTTELISISQLKAGMIVIVGMGEKIPCDGIIIDGYSKIDASIINGETNPQKITINSNVFGGTINLENPIKIKITKSFEESLLADIIKITDNIEKNKSRFVRIADNLAKFYTPIIHLLGLATFFIWLLIFNIHWADALINATAVLVISCPCALALAVPIAQTLTTAKMLRKGILINSGEALEKLQKITLIAFDKTGSLTEGKPKLIKIIDLNEEKIVDYPHRTAENQGLDNNLELMLATLSANSRHPISQAISQAINQEFNHSQNIKLENIKEERGLGVSGFYQDNQIKIGRRSFCEINNNHHQFIESTLENTNYLHCFVKYKAEELMLIFSDQLKTDALLVIKKLKELQNKIIILSGDVDITVSQIAKTLEIEEYYSELTPLDKVKILQEKASEGYKILMIGDGLNDAPAIATSLASISFNSGSDITKNNSDIIIQGTRLQPIIDIFNHSAFSVKIMKQNLALALIYNAIAIPFAMSGMVVPLFAAIAMSSSSLIVLLNSLRINRRI